MPRYLDPKADVVFKKVFAEHPNLLKSFLNAVLPLPKDGLIESLEYLPSEQVPVIPAFKSTIVDVRCKDEKGHYFIVEMQVQWTNGFMQRMLFNASKAYVKQLHKGEHYELLKPVYGLGLLNSEFNSNPEDWYHHYKIVNVKDTSREIKDLQLIFVELPKFQATTIPEKKLKILWLRFMSELDHETREIPAEWLEVPEIRHAVELSEEAAYSAGELEAYDKYWDAVRVERTLMSQSEKKGQELGLKQGREQGRREEHARAYQEKIEIAQKLLAWGMEKQQLSKIMSLPIEEILKTEG